MNWQPPSFDKHQFAGRRRIHNAVSARYTPQGWETPGIAFSDFQSMHVARRDRQQERRLDTPSWAMNDAELREVVLRLCERRFYLRSQGKLSDVSPLTDEQRRDLIREKELKWVASRRVVLHSLIAREKAGEKLDIQIQNLDSQIRMANRGNVALVTAIVYLYYRMGWDSVEVAKELRILPPLIRQTLARLHNAASGTTYISPRHQRIKVAREEMNRVRDLFRKLKKIVDATERQATEQELRRIMAGIPEPNCCKKVQWTLDRLRFIYFLRLEGKSWDAIAPKFGTKHGESIRSGFVHYMKNLHLLPDFKQAA